uniref:hypothetical protein n=1 Tax=Psychrobacter sp. TaxID=56811 RepID=UPI0015981175|nr:hypothetical protein [Psychrobacter sp.]QJS05218.1 hypothetical protein [Psychrobacter sp.]
MKLQSQDTKDPSPLVKDYVSNQASPDDEAKAQKFILTESLAEEINWLSDAEAVTKTEVVKKALHNYFSRSHHINNRRYFLEKANGPKVDLSKANTTTEVNVRWCNNKTDPIEKSIFVACHILDIDGDNVLIRPIYYPVVSTSDNAALIEKSEPIAPEFIDFDPQDIYSGLPYLHQLKYRIMSKYLWPITPISNDL